MSKPTGSLAFGTSIIRTDEYVLMAGVMVENGSTPELAMAHFSRGFKEKIHNVIDKPCLHEWDDGFNNVSKCKKCGQYSA